MIDLFIHWNVAPEAFSIGKMTIYWHVIFWGCAFFACFLVFKELLKFNKLPLTSHITRKPYNWTFDHLVIVICVAGFFIRMGNLMNSEVYGIATNLPWGFIFERNGEILPKHPIQIYEALYYALTYFVLRFVYRKCDNNPRPFLIFGLFLIMVFGFLFCIEFIKNPQENFEMFNMMQLLCTLFLIMGIISLIISRRQEKTEPLQQMEKLGIYHQNIEVMKGTKNCPYCGEEILAAARKCKYCGEWLNDNDTENGQKQTIIVNQSGSQSNGVGTAGFVLALISCFLGWIPGVGWLVWFLGLLLSFIGMFKSPRGLAVTGFIISIIGLILLLFLFGAIAAFLGLL